MPARWRAAGAPTTAHSADLIRPLEEAQAADKLMPRMKALTCPSLLVVDEIGYLPISRTGAMLFFQLMSRRYERASTVLTSNKSFEEGDEIFGDEVMAAVLIDRLLHHCHIVNVRGNSYCLRHHASITRAEGSRGPRGFGASGLRGLGASGPRGFGASGCRAGGTGKLEVECS
jgi:hypothetical protein